MRIVDDQVSNPTYAPNLAAMVRDLSLAGRTGTYRVAGRESMDRHRFTLAVCDVFGLDRRLVSPIATSEAGQKARRPLNGGLRIEKLRRDIATLPMSPEEGLRAMKAAGGYRTKRITNG